MDREFKIVISIFLFFLIYGLSSLAYSGEFVTPVFFDQLIFFGISVLFWLINIKLENSWILLCFCLAQLVYCLIDPFLMNYVYIKHGIDLAKQIYNSAWLSWIFLFVYFGFMMFASVFIFVRHKRLILLIIKMVLIVTTVMVLLIPQTGIDPSISFFAFLILYILTVNRLMKDPMPVFSVLSQQFLLVLMLESLEYLQ